MQKLKGLKRILLLYFFLEPCTLSLAPLSTKSDFDLIVM